MLYKVNYARQSLDDASLGGVESVLVSIVITPPPLFH